MDGLAYLYTIYYSSPCANLMIRLRQEGVDRDNILPVPHNAGTVLTLPDCVPSHSGRRIAPKTIPITVYYPIVNRRCRHLLV